MFLYFQSHFEENQFELHRADGHKKLKWNATPTIFDVPNPPRLLTIKRPLNRLAAEKLRAAATPRPRPEDFDHIYTKKRKRNEENIFPTVPLTVEAPYGHEYAKGSRAAKAKIPLPVEAEPNLSQASASQTTNEHMEHYDIVKNLKNKIRTLRRQLNSERLKGTNLRKNLHRFLNPDQIKCLELKSRRSMHWSNATVKKALRIRCATGMHGYEHLVKEGFPLPSYRTLCEKVEKAEFRSGIQYDVLQWLKVKIESLQSMGKDCVLAIDEMQLRPTFEYDKG